MEGLEERMDESEGDVERHTIPRHKSAEDLRTTVSLTSVGISLALSAYVWIVNTPEGQSLFDDGLNKAAFVGFRSGMSYLYVKRWLQTIRQSSLDNLAEFSEKHPIVARNTGARSLYLGTQATAKAGLYVIAMFAGYELLDAHAPIKSVLPNMTTIPAAWALAELDVRNQSAENYQHKLYEISDVVQRAGRAVGF